MKEKHIWNKNLEDLCLRNFMETGEIGYYLLYQDLKRDENGRDKPKRTGAKGKKLPRK